MSKSKRGPDSEFIESINKRGKMILKRFQQTVISGVSHPDLLSILTDVTRYWKDYFRPALTSFSCEAVGGKPNQADNASLMITIMSAGLGIHDDIIDKSQIKHFRMTLPGLYNLEKALLAGDLLIVKALTVSKEILRECSPQKAAFAIEAFESFFIEVWEGEYMEILCRKNLETKIDDYQKILWKSTADTEACARLGAVFGNGSPEEVEVLAEFGRRLGYMFRLRDEMKDCLNIEGNFYDRLKNESVPLPILYAAKSSRRDYAIIKSILQKADISSEEAQKILEICFETEALSYVRDIVRENYAKATSKLRLLKRTIARDALEAMAERCLSDTMTLTC